MLDALKWRAWWALQGGAIQRGQAVGRAERIEAVAGAAEGGVAQRAESGVQRVLQRFLQRGELAGFFPDDGVGREATGETMTSAKTAAMVAKSGASPDGLHEQRVVAGARADGGTERFQGDGDFLGAAGGGALGQGGGEQLVEAVGFRRLGGKPAADGGLEVDERAPGGPG